MASEVSPPGPAWRGLVVPGVLLVAVLAVLVSLGNWQMRRLSWKLDLIDRVESRLKVAPVPPPGPAEWPKLDQDRIDYRQVHLGGHYLPGETHVFTALGEPKGRYGGPGFWVMVPFATSDGWIVFVNRGFVPQDLKDPGKRPGSSAPKGDVTLQGTIRHAEKDGSSLAADPEKNIWYRRDPAELARAAGLDAGSVAPYTIDLNASMAPEGGLPQPGETKVTFNNPHLGYAMTWYGLAAAALGVFVAFAAGRLKRAG
ncbi:surfeit locus 1 family protein [Breoghania corrubedonensis]|uniref:SURF1-like protein n=1 Tax=Breoghania corrubedonensis TaxID=665038 RepID=A0A2T5VEU3_9HYPH|nr:SURF1 family protein [Breoghania corrubedonensis]PTW62258.1 surfeit locus 1 family protein [Breoghania corrubedonensis]